MRPALEVCRHREPGRQIVLARGMRVINLMAVDSAEVVAINIAILESNRSVLLINIDRIERIVAG